MKLSKAQQEVMDNATALINRARAYNDFETYFNETKAPHYNSSWNTADKYRANDPKGFKRLEKHWIGEKNGIVLTHANSRTLYRLRDLGLIEIINDTNGQGNWAIDTIKVLNY